jgi:hypothetical protein
VISKKTIELRNLESQLTSLLSSEVAPKAITRKYYTLNKAVVQ